jgi:hypothetical protein
VADAVSPVLYWIRWRIFKYSSVTEWVVVHHCWLSVKCRLWLFMSSAFINCAPLVSTSVIVALLTTVYFANFQRFWNALENTK